MDPIEVVVAMTIVTGICALAAWWMHSAWHRIMSDERPLALPEMIERQGIKLELLAAPGPGGASMVEQYAVSMRRCAMCGHGDECRAWLAGRGATGYERFCVNAGFIEAVKRSQREQGPRMGFA